MAPIQKCYDVEDLCPWRELPSVRRILQEVLGHVPSHRSKGKLLPRFVLRQYTARLSTPPSRDVLNRWSDDDLTLTDRRSHSDIMGRYRQLRSRNRKEENQAITVTSDSSSHKIVLDMHDFMGGDVKVKVVGEKELVVEGRMEKEEGRSSMSAHSFRRRFSLPHLTDMTAITSVMSSDGILTITVPEVEEDARQKATVIPVHVEKTENSSRMQNWESSNTSSTASAEATSVQGKSLEVDQEECECARCSLENRCQAKNTQIPLSNASHSRTEEGVSASKQSSSVFTKSSPE
ncbi:protein lethal(2)essential for life-like [Penaeus vannamei]|uniref:protein lethal(2)essential for life-like n=1 Tax=Penaeus vannamei TaxID=6689 RepID=UPI00387F9CBE